MQVTCRNLRGDCDYVATGKTADGVKKAMFDHAAVTHKAVLAKMTESDKQRVSNKMDNILQGQDRSITKSKPDKVVHFEIPADNMERAEKFYSSVFGWQTRNMPEMEYCMVTTVLTDNNMMPVESGAINGGIMKRMKKEGPVIVINVASLDDAIKKVEKAGGKLVHPKSKVADMGLYARVTDSEGNVIGLWETLKR